MTEAEIIAIVELVQLVLTAVLKKQLTVDDATKAVTDLIWKEAREAV